MFGEFYYIQSSYSKNLYGWLLTISGSKHSFIKITYIDTTRSVITRERSKKESSTICFTLSHIIVSSFPTSEFLLTRDINGLDLRLTLLNFRYRNRQHTILHTRLYFLHLCILWQPKPPHELST